MKVYTEILWRGKGWYAGQYKSSENRVVYFFIDDEPNSGWSEDRDGTIYDVARRNNLGTPFWVEETSRFDFVTNLENL